MGKLKVTDETIKNNSKINPVDLQKYSIISFRKYCENGHRAQKIYFKNICKVCGEEFIKKYYYIHMNDNCMYYLTICSNCLRVHTTNELYGVDNISQLDEIIEKKQDTTMKHYGAPTPMQSEILKPKIQKTVKERYNVDNVSQIEEVKQKKIDTSREHYGKDYYTQTEEYLERVIETNNKRYGVDFVPQNEEIKKKIYESNIENHGGVHYASTEEHCELMRNVWTEQYEKIIEKRNKTMIERYGGAFTTIHKYEYKGIKFDSSWEFIFYLYHKKLGHKIIRNKLDYFEYKKEKTWHKFYPDFKIGRKYYEIKGEQFITRYKNGKVKCLVNSFSNTLEKEKYKCLRKNKVILITVVEMQKYIKYYEKHYKKDFINKYEISNNSSTTIEKSKTE